MKTLLILLLLVPSLSWGESYIYSCTVDGYLSEEQYIISFNDRDKDFALSSVNPETGIFDEYSKFHFQNKIGKVTILGNKKEEFDLIIQHYGDKFEDNSFRAFFDEGAGSSRTFITSITIYDWDKEKPIFVYRDFTNEIYKGFCK